MVLYVLIDVFIGIFIGIRMQLFFGEVKETKRLSIAVMAEHSSGKSDKLIFKDKLKYYCSIIQTVRDSFTKSNIENKNLNIHTTC